MFHHSWHQHSVHANTFPTTILEALVCGTPVVATAVGGTPEQIEQGVTGFVTLPGDADAIAAQIVRLLDDGGLGQKMGERCWEVVILVMGWEYIS